MKTKVIPIEKVDVAKLTGDELDALKAFGKTKAYAILKDLADETKTRRAHQALEVTDLNDLRILNGVNIGVDFIIDAVERAKEELKSRGDIDTE